MEEADSYTYERIQAIVSYLESNRKSSVRPKLGIICGSGLAGLADRLEDVECFDYEQIPDFPVSTVTGHHGLLVFGKLRGVPTVVMKGRFHAYEGYPLAKCAMPVRVMKLLGVEVAIITNAAGCVNPDYNVGDIMIIKDHINIPGFAGNNPLKGLNDDRWGPRFPAMSKAYNSNLRQLAKKCAKDLGMADFVREGVYCMYGGPCYETVAEVKMIRLLGSDVVGMSTVHEAIVAQHCGLKIIGMSLVTNRCVADWDSTEVAHHAEVVEVGRKRARELEKLVSRIVEELQKENVLK
ncbi:Purine nucleoside phosphorylase [Halotydeus destructor]|nr:Purine nucleoside phosphorylase [Halotydeus destructor]